MRQKTRAIDEETQEKAIRLLDMGLSVASVSQLLGIPYWTVDKLKRHLDELIFYDDEEIQRLMNPKVVIIEVWVGSNMKGKRSTGWRK